MWRPSASRLISQPLFRRYPAIKQTQAALADHPILPTPWARHRWLPFSSPASPSLAASVDVEGDGDGSGGGIGPVNQKQEGESISFLEAKKLMRLVNVEVLKRKLEKERAEVVGYSEMLEVCEATGVSRSRDEAAAFVKVLDEAGVVLLFRDKVYLHPDKIVDLMSKAVPLALTPENDPRREEFTVLQKKKEEIDILAHKQVRNILSSGLLILVTQVGLFFRLTFWEFSWDVMEPIAFFTTTTGLIIGYAYFLMTSRDPTYQDFMQRLFLSRQRKLFKKKIFDVERYLELQKHCKCPLGSDSKGMGHNVFHTD